MLELRPMINMNIEEPVACVCRFDSDFDKARAIGSLLEEHGDIPEDEILRAITPDKLDKWETLCDCNDLDRVLSGCRREQTDWYLWTIKNLATHKDYRERGLGGNVTRKSVEKSIEEGARVLACDITIRNEPSRKIFEKLGFKRVNSFCWAKGEKPADILHFVYYPPVGEHCD